MLVLEHLRSIANPQRWTVRIFATDIDLQALDFARAGRYPLHAASEIPAHLRDRYFVESQGFLEAVPLLRHLMVFVPHNLLNNPPFISMNLVACRNVMIFLRRETKRLLLAQLHRALVHPHGFLVLGNAEQTGAQTQDMFAPVATGEGPGRGHVYRPVRITPTDLQRPSTFQGWYALITILEHGG